MAIPTSEKVCEDLQSILAVVRGALAFSTQKTHQFFKGEAEQAADRSLGPALVRYYARRYLDAGGHRVFDLDEDYERDTIGNNGLLLRYRDYQLRIRKAANGELPPSTSETLDDFYKHNFKQYELWPQLVEKGALPEPTETMTNVVVLWDVGFDYKLTSLQLVLPKRGGSSPQSYWAVYLSLAEIDQQQNNDLDIKPKPEQKGEEEDEPGKK